ncbi:MAG: hypothetical protein R3B95_00245 [Nitrospirales bacterium]|nr:hypothetical protein [Nitrospirales bacterium]
MERQGRPVVIVWPGKGFERCADGIYRVRPDSRDDHELLLQELTSRDRLPSCLLHAWTIGDEPEEVTATSRIQVTQEGEFSTSSFLRRSLGADELIDSQSWCCQTGYMMLRARSPYVPNRPRCWVCVVSFHRNIRV